MTVHFRHAVVLVAMLAWPADVHSQSAQDRRLVSRLVARWETSWNSYDLREVDSLFFRDESVTYFSSERAGLIAGIARLREHHQGFGFRDGGVASSNRLWLADTVTHWSGRVATVLATWHFRRGDGTQQSGPVTLVVAPRGRGYRIAHAHFSNAPPG
jgi:ketosteroid isomerase-like protein